MHDRTVILQELRREDGQVNKSSQHTTGPNRMTKGIQQLASLGEFGDGFPEEVTAELHSEG